MLTFQEKTAENGCTQDNCHRSFASVIAWDGKRCRAGVYSRRSVRRSWSAGPRPRPTINRQKNGERRSALRLGVELFAGDDATEVFNDLLGGVIAAGRGDIPEIALLSITQPNGEAIKFFCTEEI